MKKINLVLVIIISISTAISAATIQEKLTENGFATADKTVPSINFKLENIEGTEKELTDYRGKVVFLNFWATWCGPCRYEMPSMEKLYKEFKNDGLEILAINLGESAPDVGEFMEEYKLSFPALLDTDRSISLKYGVRSIPTTYLIGRDGNILGMVVGAREWDSDAIKQLFREILE